MVLVTLLERLSDRLWNGSRKDGMVLKQFPEHVSERSWKVMEQYNCYSSETGLGLFYYRFSTRNGVRTVMERFSERFSSRSMTVLKERS